MNLDSKELIETPGVTVPVRKLQSFFGTTPSLISGEVSSEIRQC